MTYFEWKFNAASFDETLTILPFYFRLGRRRLVSLMVPGVKG